MRGSYSTPAVPPRSAGSTASSDGPFTYEWVVYGESKSHTIDPATFETPAIATELGRTWLQVLTEFGRFESQLANGLREFLSSVGQLPLSDDEKRRFALSDLRRAHIDLWELNMLARHREAQSDTNYRKVLYLFALLRRYEDDHPGTLHEAVRERLERQPRLWHHRNEGLPALSKEEAREWRRWAYLKVRSALAQPDRGISDIDVHTATHVLLSLSTGEPPEVLRALTIDDIEATTTPEVEAALTLMAPSERLAHLAEHDHIERIRVRYTKNRAGGEVYDEVYARRDTAPFKAMRWTIMLNASARAESGNPSLILMRDAGGTVRQPPWNRAEYRLASVAERNGVSFTGPNYWARLRKTVTTREALADPRSYLSKGRRHSAETFFGSYTNSPVLRAEAGRVLVEGVNDLFERALTGPTIVTPEAEDALRAGATAPGLDKAMAQALVAGRLDGPQAGCRDPLSSPYEADGSVCTKSMTGTCFGCPNALITRHHLPAAIAIQDLAHPDKAANPETWLHHWKPIYDTITEVILPAFTPEQIEEARQRADLTPIDPGVLNDMRGPQERGAR